MPGAAGSGGYRKPTNPAPVSGPGAGSKRTDGGPAQKLRDLPDAAYGEAATFRDLQQKAPLAQTPGPARPQGTSRGSGMSKGAAAFAAPTQYPDQAVTAGLNEPSMLPDPQVQIEQEDLERLKQYLPALIEMAHRPDATRSFRNYVRMLRSKVR